MLRFVCIRLENIYLNNNSIFNSSLIVNLAYFSMIVTEI